MDDWKVERETRKADKKRLREIIDAGNVAEVMSDEELNRMGASVTQMYELDLNDPVRQTKAEKWEKGQNIVQQILERKNTPIDNASNVKYPLLTTACIQFNARAYPAVITGNNVVKPQMVGETAIQNLTKEKLQQMPQEDQQKAQQLAQGIAQKQGKADRACEYMNWQLFNELTEWEEDMDRLLLMLPLYGDMYKKIWNSTAKNRLESKIISPEHLVVPSNTSTLEDAPRIAEEFTLFPNQIEERIRQGTYIPFNFQPEGEDRDAAHDFIEQHGWFDLDDDGYKEPYIVIVHKRSSNVCQVIPNFQMKDIEVNDDGEVSRITPIVYFTRYSFIPSSDGSFYSLGFFDILYPINEVVDTTINQMMDAGRLANSNSGFIAREARIKKGPVQFAVGEWKAVSVRGDDIRKGMIPMEFPGPSQTLFQLLGFMIEAGREVANIKDVLMGETQNAQQPATTTLALIEQGTKVFSAIHKRIYRSLKAELKVLSIWNNRTLDEERYREVTDAPVQADDFDDTGYDFIPVADPEVATDMQRMGRAEFLLSFQGNPGVNQKEVLRRAFEAANIDDIDDLLEMDPQVQQLQQQLKEMQQAMQQMQQGAQKKIEQLGGEQQQKRWELQMSEQKRKEIETDVKARKAEAEILEKEASAVDKIASAEAREPGQQLEQYKAQAGIENERMKIQETIDDNQRGRILELANASRNPVGNAGTGRP